MKTSFNILIFILRIWFVRVKVCPFGTSVFLGSDRSWSSSVRSFGLRLSRAVNFHLSSRVGQRSLREQSENSESIQSVNSRYTVGVTVTDRHTILPFLGLLSESKTRLLTWFLLSFGTCLFCRKRLFCGLQASSRSKSIPYGTDLVFTRDFFSNSSTSESLLCLWTLPMPGLSALLVNHVLILVASLSRPLD